MGALVYTLTAIASFITWWVATSALASLRARSPKLGAAIVGVIGPIGTLLTVGSIHYRRFFDTDIRPIAVAYFMENPRYAASLVAHALTPTLCLALGGCALFGIVSLALVTAQPFAEEARPPRWAVTLVLAPVALVSIPAVGFGKYPCIAEVRGERALLLGLSARGLSEPLHALPVPHRRAVPRAAPLRSPDVVWLVGESRSADRTAPWDGREPAANGLMARLAREPDATVWFPDAASIAPVTAVSVPSMLSGLAPDASIDDFREAPLVWHEARARGYRTAFFSSQDFHVDFFEGFYLSDGGPDESKNANDHPDRPRVDDRGIADEVTVDDALSFAERAPRDRPILLVVQTNATHWPCWAPDLDPARAPSIAERCALAERYVDRELGRLLEGLARSRGLDDTIVLGTSDHGENFDRERPARAIDYYQGVLRVPLFVRVPKSFCAAASDACAALRDNRRLRATNLDLLPTLLDVWGSWPPRDARPTLAGESLLRPLPADRVTLAMAESAIWTSLADGLAIFDGHDKWIIDELHGVRLFDLERDPGETRDLAAEASTDAVARLRAELSRHPRAREVCRRVSPGIIEGPWAPTSW